MSIWFTVRGLIRPGFRLTMRISQQMWADSLVLEGAKGELVRGIVGLAGFKSMGVWDLSSVWLSLGLAR